MENLLYPINLFIQGVQQGWISFNYAQNFDAEERSITFIGSSTPTNNVLSFQLKKAVRPKEVRVRQLFRSDNTGTIATSNISYTYNNGTLTITAVPDLTDGISYTINLLVYFQ